MIDHIVLHTRQLAIMTDFYGEALRPLGYGELLNFGEAVGYGVAGQTRLWIGSNERATTPVHLAIAAGSRAAVDAFYAAAIAAGATNNGEPGLRTEYHPHYYGAFVIDPDGHNLEAVCHHPE